MNHIVDGIQRVNDVQFLMYWNCITFTLWAHNDKKRRNLDEKHTRKLFRKNLQMTGVCCF